MTDPHNGSAVPRRRTAFAEGAEQLRAAATTEPGRLRIIGAVLALLVLAFGAVTAWQTSARAAAADDVVERSQPLTADAAAIYVSLADANTAAASGFLAEGQEPAKVRERYESDIRTAARKLATAAANSKGSGTASAEIATLNALLPEYTERVQTARTYNRQGLPLGGAYLRNANDLMQTEMLPAAKELYDAEKARLSADYDAAKSYPWAALALGVLALAALGWAQRRNYRRTNRVFNLGLVTATGTSAAALLWLLAGHTLAFTALGDSYDHGVRSLNVLHDARISTLQARSNENLTLVARGAVTVPDGPDAGQDKYDVDYRKLMHRLDDGGSDQARSGLLGAALVRADDDEGRAPVVKAMDAVTEWQERHKAAREADMQGDYEKARDRVIGDDKATGESFDRADKALEQAVAHEQQDFRGAAEDGRDAMTGLPVGAAVVAVLGAAGAVLGIGRRLSEYR
ncbi:hypothetical protein QIS99_12805 [Streptomyces sp. B-S-A8]|uniref:Secreted protein n=1 Tax=Streptomyces solicavernae TaxID=3043614 RepID=A0ABT6RTR6_9ACTN|nr:hypothetical protein [Streptomyces sp. B-S-A8]MDI3387071.1 hypothetical protein [Streptomyces sp. B-S-A8]